MEATEDQAKVKPTVVGIGASAGGLAALRQLFELIPADSGIAFVVVVHLSPEHKSLLADLLQPCVNFPVQQVTETVPLEANNVYVIPPNANISAIDTHLRLSALEEKRRERAPIDHFFRTMAATHDGHSIGVVLTGTGSDGTLGLREIKAKGGVILVQDPNEAEFDGMPQSAISTGMVDRILPIAEIATALMRLAQSERSIDVRNDPDGALEIERALLPKVLAVLRARTDRDFSRYKTATLLRRIGRRMQLNYIDSFAKYVDIVREQPDEARALADDLLINVTSFFRDAEVFEKLRREIIPRFFEGRTGTDSVRVWSVGCATGEEAYSLAMLLLEEKLRRPESPKIQIFASDLHKRSLDSAREGLYPGDIETDVSGARLKRFFQKENGGYRICKEVRDMVVFAPHNLLGDPPFSRLDLISCRNLLIYLDRSIQRDVVDLFHYALCPQGYLLLGSAETAEASDLFRTEDKKLCIYEKRNVPAPDPKLPVFPLTRMRRPGERLDRPDRLAVAVPFQSVHQNLLERFAPPSILVGLDNRVVHLSENANRYLVLPGGEIPSSVLRLVREELRVTMQSLLQKARETKQPLDSAEIVVRFDGFSAPVVMHVRPAPDSDQEEFILVIFEEHQAIKPDGSSTSSSVFGTYASGDTESRVVALEQALMESRQELQTVIEEYETSQEEMKVANEEMQSTNEELRSTMEELETSKEELQSINEELQTVNQENRHKVEELSHLSSDLQNLLASTDIATLFLDRDLRILRFTPRLSDIFNVRVTDRGRPISDLTHRLGYQELREDAMKVLDRLAPLEREIEDDRQRWYLTRVLPYRSVEDRIEGIVVTFTDITQRKQAETALRESEGNLRGVANVVPDLLWYSDLDGSTPWYNDRWLAYTGQGFEHASGWGWSDAIHPDDRENSIRRYREAVELGKPLQQEHRIRQHTGQYRWFLVRAEPRLDSLGRVTRMYGAATDIHDQRLAMEALRESEERFRLFVENVREYALIQTDLEATVTSWNPGAERLFGYSSAEIVGKPFVNLLPEADRQNGMIAREMAKLSRSEKNIAASTVQRKDGSRFWAEWVTEPVLDDTGALRGTAKVIRDESDRQEVRQTLEESERRLRAVLEGIPQLVWRSHDEGQWTWASSQWRGFTGQTQEESLGEGWLNVIHPEDRAATVAAWADADRTGKLDVEHRILRASDGVYIWHHTRSLPAPRPEGATREWLGTSTDIEMSKAAAAEKDALLREVHHRVKNNLQVIVSLLNMQSSQIQEETVLAQFQEARNRILAISSIHELLYRADSFAGIVLTDYARQLAPGLVRFYGLDSRVTLTITGDGNKLELERAVPFGMLLNELISNACKHAFPAENTGTLRIGVDRRGDELEVTVADDGAGLPKDFDYEEVTSLGLKLVHALARQLRGTVQVSSTQGTTILIRFPANLTEEDA